MSQKNERSGCGVHKLPLRLWIWAATVLLMPWVTHAAGLGKLTITSALGQPLAAQIELVSVHRDESGSLAARLASQDTYRQANLQYLPALASLRFSIGKRASGQPYVQVTSTRPINEPVVDLLVELAWSSGSISRAYTALIDPPGYGPSSSASAEAVALPETRPIAPPGRTAGSQAIPANGERAVAGQYGPIKRGETLAGIASSIKPEGVTLEQMLVGLYRNNPDAFVKNMNRMKTGRILRVPEKEEVAAMAPGDALKEVRVQASDWHAYRRRLADAAGSADEKSATSGRITARVEEPGEAAASRDVVRLSKGEAPGAPGSGAGSAGDRLRALEEESVAREKALTEAQERIAQLEKTIREQQRLLTLKGAPLGTQPESPAAKPAQPAVQGADAPSPAPAQASAAAESAPVEPPAAAAPAKEAPATPAAPPQAQPKVVPPPPPPSSDLMDVLLEEPLYLGAAGGVILLAVLVYVLGRRRRAAESLDEDMEREAPVFGPSAGAVTPTARPDIAGSASVAVPVVDVATTEEVDALAEAEVYIAYGRDAQAEEILKEALGKAPARQDVQLKLLEVYAARKDRSSFKALAGRLRQQTGGAGEAWVKAAAMGRTLDPEDALYAAAGAAVAATAVADAPATRGAVRADPLDLDLSAAVVRPGVSTDVMATPPVDTPRPGSQSGSVEPHPHRPAGPQVQPLASDFTLEIPSATSDATPAPVTTDVNVIDFNLELPKVESAEASTAPAARPGADAGLDFKLDFGDIDLHLDDETPATPAVGGKDAHWHDVQQKFDLAKAYEEMGDKDGAREVLKEVLGEGDQDQQAQATKLLKALA